MKYEYRGKFYDSESKVDEAVCEYLGQFNNNIDPMDTVAFDDEWRWEVSVLSKVESEVK